MKRKLLRSVLLVLFLAALAVPAVAAGARRRAVGPVIGPVADEQRILLPIFGMLLGNRLGPFVAVFVAHNPMQTPVIIEGVTPECPLSPCSDPVPPAIRLDVGENVIAPANNLTGIPTRFIYLPPAATVDIGVRLINLLRPSPNAVEVPIVRDADLRTGTISLLPVTAGGGLRDSLRIFTLV